MTVLKFIFYVLIPLLTSCAGGGVMLAPENPLTTWGKNTRLRTDVYPVGHLGALTKDYWDPKKTANAQANRDAIVHMLMMETDNNFDVWALRVFGSRITANTAADVATGVLSTVAVGSGPSSAKSIGVAIASIMGVRTATQKHLFQEQSAAALYLKMKQQRADVETQILQYLKKPVAEYPLHKALRDLERYYEAGTLAAASERLAVDAGRQAILAEAQREEQKGDKVVAPTLLDSAGFGILPQLRQGTTELGANVRNQRQQSIGQQEQRQRDLTSVSGKIKDMVAEGDLILQKFNDEQNNDTQKIAKDYSTIIKAGKGTVGTGPGEYPNGNIISVINLVGVNAQNAAVLDEMLKAATVRKDELYRKLIPAPAP